MNGFEVFWSLYPRKIAKIYARRVWERKIKAPMVPVILKALALQRKYNLAFIDEQFIPHPATWLNRERWTDPIRQCKPGAIAPLDHSNFTTAEWLEIAEDIERMQREMGGLK